MAVPRVCVVRAPGTNCDPETAFAFEMCGAKADRVHLQRLIERPALLRDYQVFCMPGGFSYGDDVGAGVICGTQLRHHLKDVLGEFLSRDTLVLGICNGFQVLMRAGLLPDGIDSWNRPLAERAATLTWNNNGRYTARWVRLATAGNRSVFFRDIAHLELPMAHAEGRIVVRSPEVVAEWSRKGQVAVCYASATAVATPASPSELLAARLEEQDNPNGSESNIAGLCDPTGRVLGLMPHPERFLFPHQHPNWTRRHSLPAEGQGLALFRNAVSYFE